MEIVKYDHYAEVVSLRVAIAQSGRTYPLSPRTMNAVTSENIHPDDIDAICAKSAYEWLRVPMFGTVCIIELNRYVELHGSNLDKFDKVTRTQAARAMMAEIYSNPPPHNVFKIVKEGAMYGHQGVWLRIVAAGAKPS